MTESLQYFELFLHEVFDRTTSTCGRGPMWILTRAKELGVLLPEEISAEWPTTVPTLIALLEDGDAECTLSRYFVRTWPDRQNSTIKRHEAPLRLYREVAAKIKHSATIQEFATKITKRNWRPSVKHLKEVVAAASPKPTNNTISLKLCTFGYEDTLELLRKRLDSNGVKQAAKTLMRTDLAIQLGLADNARYRFSITELKVICDLAGVKLVVGAQEP